MNGVNQSDEWAPGIPKKNPYHRVDQATAWELFDKSNRYYEQADAEAKEHPSYARFLRTSARELRAAATYVLTLNKQVN